MTEFAHLLAPGSIGSLALRNRILMAPMGDSLANPDGTVSATQLAYFEARARGGAALLLVGSVAVAYPDGCVDERQVAASDDSQLPGLQALADRVHAHGAAVAAQLTYNGALARLDISRGHPMLVPAVPRRPQPDRLSMMVTDEELAGFMAPYASPSSRVEYRVATDEDLAEVVEQFADATDRCRRAGIDGVELHAGHGYLIDEFLSPSLNTRTDEWGGSVEGRARLLGEIVGAIRDRVGPDYPVWMRINALEHHKPDGETFADQLAVIRAVVPTGLDAVHVTAYASMDVATGPTDSYAPHRVGGLAAYAAQVRAAVDVPVITFGRFEPAEAEAVLARGDADFVAMGRKLLADPDLPNKLLAGTVEQIRPCLYQYRCIGNIFVNESLACVANAATGREDQANVPVAMRSWRVLVVGGGAAGLECARVLADAGHRVEVCESGTKLGGVLEGIRDLDPVLDQHLAWLVGEVDRLGVEIRLATTVDAETVDRAGTDAVVIATGPRWEHAAPVPILTPPQLRAYLDGDHAVVGERVAILGGGKPALTLATSLSASGHAVTVIEAGAVFGAELGLPGRWRMVADLEAAGAVLLGNAAVRSFGAETIDVTVEDAAPRRIPTDTVISTLRVAGRPTLAGEIQGTGMTTFVVGDARAAAGFEGITRDAEDVARALAG